MSNGKKEPEYRKKPSDLPYRATKWMDVASRAWRRLEANVFWLAFGSVLAVSGDYVMDLSSTAEMQDQCEVTCHPYDYKLAGGECWCLPEGAPATKGGAS